MAFHSQLIWHSRASDWVRFYRFENAIIHSAKVVLEQHTLISDGECIFKNVCASCLFEASTF